VAKSARRRSARRCKAAVKSTYPITRCVTLSRNDAGAKIAWQGLLLAVRPRIRLTRSFDRRSQNYLGYTLKVRSRIGSEVREFLVRVGGAGRLSRARLSAASRADLPGEMLELHLEMQYAGGSNSTAVSLGALG
jgi:hypothetical protein